MRSEELSDGMVLKISLRKRFYHESLKRGGVAQSGEHLLCKQGVRGSNPLPSTNFPR